MRRDSKIVDIEPAFIQPADLLPKRIGAKAKSGERRSRDGVEKVAKEAACSASSSSKYSSKNLDKPTTEEAAEKAAAERKRRYR
jgi:hypothetical protein